MKFILNFINQKPNQDFKISVFFEYQFKQYHERQVIREITINNFSIDNPDILWFLKECYFYMIQKDLYKIEEQFMLLNKFEDLINDLKKEFPGLNISKLNEFKNKNFPISPNPSSNPSSNSLPNSLPNNNDPKTPPESSGIGIGGILITVGIVVVSIFAIYFFVFNPSKQNNGINSDGIPKKKLKSEINQLKKKKPLDPYGIPYKENQLDIYKNSVN